MGQTQHLASSSLVIDLPTPAPAGARVHLHPAPRPLWAALPALALVAAWVLLAPPRSTPALARAGLLQYPLQLPGGWAGQSETLDRQTLATLAVDDHLMANFKRPGEPNVNFYVAYYASQSGGQSNHSPRTCMPGGGWRLATLQATDVALPQHGSTQRLNRAVIEQGEQRQLVYYWFAQRGRVLTNELLVKWFILLDGLLHRRSDGALVRLVTPILPNENEAQAEQRLASFMDAALPALQVHFPTPLTVVKVSTHAAR